MPEYTQENRLISIAVNGLGPNDLLLQSFTASEAISRPFAIQADVLSQLPTVDFLSIIGQQATITVQTNDESNPRFFNGYVSRFAQSGSDKLFHHYHLEIVPWIWFLSREADCRIFHNLSIPEIVQKIFDDFSANPKGPISINLQNTYNKLEYTVQYRETALNFVSRLMEYAGIYYYFEHSETDHTLWLADKSTSATDCPIQGSASHIVRNTDLMDEDYIASMYETRQIKTGMYTATDYNFKMPATNLVATENTVISAGGNDSLETFDYPGLYQTLDEGRTLTKTRMEEQEAGHQVITGNGRVRSFLPGYAFTLKDHYRADMNISYLLTELRHSATVGGSYHTGDAESDSYTNQFVCIPKKVPYQPPRVTPKPFVQGPQTAVVVGKSSDQDSADDDSAGGDGEEIWVDKYGRVMVLFPWDRKKDCSCWVRVSQDWAGKGWGMISIPRVGQEVIVSFLEGDPDRPIITGRVYNAEQTVPYTLPDNGTRTTFRTSSSTGGGTEHYNELRFEDKTGSEQVFVRGEMDYDTRILKDSREWIGNQQSVIVTKDRLEKVGGDESIQITGKRTEKVGGDDNVNVTGNINQKAGQTISIQAGQNLYEKSGQNFAHEAGQMIHLKGGMTVVIEAGMQLSLKVGGNFIDIGPAGVSITGTMVMINSGGSPASGCGSSPTDPANPKDPDEADDGSKGTKMN